MTTHPLTAASLLGTARMGAPPMAPDPALEEIWQAIDWQNPAAAVLQALALTRAMQRAGIRPTAAETIPEPSRAESLPEMKPAMMDAALRMLKGEFSEVLPEWLALATRAGLLLPGRGMPEFLREATRNRALRAAVRQLAGERGIWIARRRPEFTWLLEESAVPDEAWDGDSPAERLAWLRQTRATNPQRAAEAISSQWAGEDGSFREAVVGVVAESPQPCDEVWLETLALKDRRQEIRETAATALMRLSSAELSMHLSTCSALRPAMRPSRTNPP